MKIFRGVKVKLFRFAKGLYSIDEIKTVKMQPDDDDLASSCARIGRYVGCSDVCITRGNQSHFRLYVAGDLDLKLNHFKRPRYILVFPEANRLGSNPCY